MHATKAAVEEGIVPGGGVAMLRAATALDTLKVDDDQQLGVNIIRRAIEEPMRWIAQNAGFEGSIVVQKVRAATASDEARPRHELHVAGAVCRRTAGGESGAKGIERHGHVNVFMRVDADDDGARQLDDLVPV